MAARPSTAVYLGLGSNLGDRAATILAARDALVASGTLDDARLSPLYETDAVAAEPQPDYLNAVIRGTTTLGPERLLEACLRIEAALGRVRPAGVEKAPRAIDIDILLYGDTVLRSPTLTIPHPALLERAFVLIPLAAVATPGLRHPITAAPLDHPPPATPTVRPFP